MDILVLVKCLFFLEGLLLAKFSPRLLLEGDASILEYGLGYILGFAWIWYCDQSRQLAPTLITCIGLSMTSKWFLKDLLPFHIGTFLYIFSTCMIIPLTCAFTMMQCNPRQKRESWSLQYSFLLLGRLARNFIPLALINQHGFQFDVVLSLLFVLVAGSIPWFQARKLTEISLDQQKKKPEQVYTPISGLLGQIRYFYFLLSVLCASFFFYFIRAAAMIFDVSSVPSDPRMVLCAEILTCWAAFLLCPRRIPPQRFFLLAQLLVASGFLALSFAPPSCVEIVSAVGVVAFSVANAQIVATHGKPGLEYTTCALVDITRNGLGPIAFVLLRHLNSDKFASSIGCAVFILGFAGKYFLLDYPHDELIKKKTSTNNNNIFIHI